MSGVTNGTNSNPQLNSLMENLHTAGGIVRDTARNAVEFGQQQYESINEKHPGFGAILGKIGLIFGTALSFLLRPFSTAIGFTVGLLFSKDVKNLLDKVNDWFKNASPAAKGFSIAGAAIGLIFTPILGGFATGAYSGHKVAEWMSTRNQEQQAVQV